MQINEYIGRYEEYIGLYKQSIQTQIFLVSFSYVTDKTELSFAFVWPKIDLVYKVFFVVVTKNTSYLINRSQSNKEIAI